MASSTPVASPTPAYTVTHQTHTKVYNEDGTQGHKWTVGLQHADGTKGEVELPDSHYTAENVHALARNQAETVAAVAKLPAM